MGWVIIHHLYSPNYLLVRTLRNDCKTCFSYCGFRKKEMEMHVDFEQGSYELVSPKTGAC
jgi:hypothetical protein